MSVHGLTRNFVLESETDRRQMLGFLSSLVIHEGRQPWRVTIEPDSDKRSNKQNARMWGVFRYIAANAWVGGQQFSPEAWHGHYCERLIGWEELPGGGRQPLGTSTLNTKEHNDFVERVMQEAATEHGVDWTHWEERR